MRGVIMLYAGPFNPPVIRQLLRINISLMVSIEFIQNVMISFASSYLCGALGMTRHTFSFSTAIYAATAIILISQHHWLVSHLGYRRFIRYALAAFTLGALICAHAQTPNAYILGRFVQAIGGSAFFTAARVHVNFFPATPSGRGLAIRYMAYSLVGCSAAASMLAATLLEHFSWRAMFLIQLPQIGLVWWLSGKTVSNVRKQRRAGRLHSGSMLSLVAGVLLLQYVAETVPYDISDLKPLLLLLPFAIAGLALFIYVEHRRHRSSLPFRHLFSSRYLVGLFYYALCYLILSSVNYLIPIFLQQGLAIPVLNCGLLVSSTGLIALGFAWIHLNTAARYPYQKHYLLFAFACLTIFGFSCSQFTPQMPLWTMALPLLFLSGFTAIGQGTAAFHTFRETDNRIFSQAYQTKNILRELMNSTGITITNVFLQNREALHYTRIAENLPLTTTTSPQYSTTTLLAVVNQQVVVMSCLDWFLVIGMTGLFFLFFSAWQRRVV
jgi:DHA2 family multidrug resistance protein